jgi:hypothetical protein
MKTVYMTMAIICLLVSYIFHKSIDTPEIRAAWCYAKKQNSSVGAIDIRDIYVEQFKIPYCRSRLTMPTRYCWHIIGNCIYYEYNWNYTVPRETLVLSKALDYTDSRETLVLSESLDTE